MAGHSPRCSTNYPNQDLAQQRWLLDTCMHMYPWQCGGDQGTRSRCLRKQAHAMHHATRPERILPPPMYSILLIKLLPYSRTCAPASQVPGRPHAWVYVPMRRMDGSIDSSLPHACTCTCAKERVATIRSRPYFPQYRRPAGIHTVHAHQWLMINLARLWMYRSPAPCVFDAYFRRWCPKAGRPTLTEFFDSTTAFDLIFHHQSPSPLNHHRNSSRRKISDCCSHRRKWRGFVNMP
jgi:hypothetical protein